MRSSRPEDRPPCREDVQFGSQSLRWVGIFPEHRFDRERQGDLDVELAVLSLQGTPTLAYLGWPRNELDCIAEQLAADYFDDAA